MRTTTLVFVLGLLLSTQFVTAGDWPAFRGPRGSGISDERDLPTDWDSNKNVRWKVALPQPCNGSPIVSNGRVFVTCAEDADGKLRSLYCYDRKNGEKLWVQTVDFGKKMPTHETNPYCGTTPAATEDRVVVWHGSGGLHCYDFEGQSVWSRDFGEFKHMWGHGTSPVIHGDRVILHSGPGEKQVFVASIDLASGRTIWKTDEPQEGNGSRNAGGKPMGSWCTPVITEVDGKDQIICTMPTRIVAYDAADGSVVWSCGGVGHDRGDLAYSSPVLAGNICVAIGGYRGPGIAVRLGGKGDITDKLRLWRKEQSPQSIGSGVFLEGYIYRPNAGPGTIECLDPATGEVVWTGRAGTQWGSMVYGGGHCYVTDQSGTTFVFAPNSEKLDLVATNRLGETSNSTPAISDGEIFLRTHENLYCIAD